MKKLSILRRCLCAFLASLMMISYSSCSKNKQNINEPPPAVQVAEGHKIENYFTASPFEIPGGLTYVKSITSTDDRIFFSGFCEQGAEKTVMSIYDPASGDSESIDPESLSVKDVKNVFLTDDALYMYFSDGSGDQVLGLYDRKSGTLAAKTGIGSEYISSMFIDKNGDLKVLTYGKGAVDSSLETYDPASLKLKSSENLNKKLEIAEGEYICFIVTGKDGNYYMFSRNGNDQNISLYICDDQLNINGSFEKVTAGMKGEFSGAFIRDNGKVGVITCDHSQMLAVYNVGLYDTQSEELSGIYDPKLGQDTFVMPLLNAEGYDFVYSDGSVFYGCDAEKQTSTELLDCTKAAPEFTDCYTASANGSEYVLYSVTYQDDGGLKNAVTDHSGKLLYTIDIQTGKDSSLSALTVLENGKAAVSEIVYTALENGEYAQKCRIHLVDETGKEISSFEVEGRENENEHEGAFSDIYSGVNGNIYVPYNVYNDGTGNPAGRIFVYDSEGNFKYTVKGEDILYIESLIIAKDKDYFVYTDGDGFNRTALFDDAGKKADFNSGLDIDPDTITYFMKGNEAYDLCFSTPEGIYGLKTEGAEVKEILNWIDSDLDFDVQKTSIIDSDTILCYVWDYNTSSNVLYKLDRADEKLLAEIQSKEIITVAGIGIADSIVYDAVLYFNKNSSGFRIQLEDYDSIYSDGKYVRGEDRLNSTIESGTIPDIIIGNQLVNMNAFAASGKFEDLSIFFERDKETDKTLLTPNILDIFASGGKQYQLPVAYSIRTLAGKTSVLGEEKGWTLSKFLEEAEKGDMFFRPGRAEMLISLVTENLSEYVDFSSKTCTFNTEEFRQLLEYIKKNGMSDADFEKAVEEMSNANDGNSAYLDYLKRFTEGKCIAEKKDFSNFSEIASFENNILREKAAFKGIPSSSGNGCLISSDIVAAIAADSKKKDAAWGFLRGLLTDSFQAGLGSSYPLNMDVFDYYLSFAMENESSSSEANADGEYVTSGLLSEDAARSVVDAVSKASRAVVYDSHISDIINEETEKFFNGDQTAEEASGYIQKRTSSYLESLK